MHEIRTKSILSPRNGINVYRGCTHGCVYCDSRSACYQMDHAFEDVAVKVNAPELLEDALRRKRRRCMVGTGSMSDPYLPLERETRLTRRCLEVIERQGFGVSVLTKSDLLLRDLDLLTRINQTAKAVVCTTFTTFDENLCRVLEPNVCTTRRRFEMLKTCHEAACGCAPFFPFSMTRRRTCGDCWTTASMPGWRPLSTSAWVSHCGRGTGSTFTPSWTGISPA